ncbi:MAG: ABC-type transporter, integral rane subunit [Candidatus Peribacteria bacterium]|nr:ABC-type transporter, integral rane subunit [Candidatus Peribacteria bacterium]
MQRAFVAGLMIAIIAPLIGIFLVTRRYALMADTLSHIALAGVALGVLIGVQPVVSAVLTAVIGAVSIETLRRKRAAQGEQLLSLFLSGGLAIAVILMSIAPGGNANFVSYLFGSITTVSQTDVSLILGLGLLVILTVTILYKKLFLLSVDEELAEAGGIKASIYNTILVILAAVTVSLSMRIVGILLVGALMVIPVLTGMQIARSFRHTLIIAVICSLLSVTGGLFISYYGNLASGGTIVICALGFFLLALGWKGVR